MRVKVFHEVRRDLKFWLTLKMRDLVLRKSKHRYEVEATHVPLGKLGGQEVPVCLLYH